MFTAKSAVDDEVVLIAFLVDIFHDFKTLWKIFICTERIFMNPRNNGYVCF